MDSEQQQEAIKLLGEAYDLIQIFQEQPRPYHHQFEAEIQELKGKINDLLYSTI